MTNENYNYAGICPSFTVICVLLLTSYVKLQGLLSTTASIFSSYKLDKSSSLHHSIYVNILSFSCTAICSKGYVDL